MAGIMPFRGLRNNTEFTKILLNDVKDLALKDPYPKKKLLAYQKAMDVTGQEILLCRGA